MAVPLKELSKLVENFRDFKSFRNISLKNESDIEKIPITTREDLAKLTLNDCPEIPVVVGATSGSTGKNLYVFFSRKAHEMKEKRVKQIMEINKIKKDNIILNLMAYGMQLSGNVVECSFIRSNNTIVPLGGSDDIERLMMLSHILDKIKPNIVFSTMSIASHLIDKSIYNGSCIKKCFVAGEVLLPEFRRLIENRGIQVYNLYGLCEAGGVAVQENPKDEFMRILDGVYIEILNNNGKISETGRGEILITDLFNFSSPIIRYRVGDEIEIKEKNDKKYMRIFGRRDNFTNINESVIPNNLLIGKIMEILGNNKFFIKITKNYKTYKDFVVIYLQEKDMKLIREVKTALRGMGINCDIIFRKTDKGAQKTITGKSKHIIDARKLKLDDKKLNW